MTNKDMQIISVDEAVNFKNDNNRRFVTLNRRGVGKSHVAKIAKELQARLKEGETAKYEAAPMKPTSRYAFKLKPCTLAVHQALSFYAAWNWMTKNGVAE